MNGFTLADIKTSAFDETWEPVWGEVKSDVYKRQAMIQKSGSDRQGSDAYKNNQPKPLHAD